jgi:hypothetical protein
MCTGIKPVLTFIEDCPPTLRPFTSPCEVWQLFAVHAAEPAPVEEEDDDDEDDDDDDEDDDEVEEE